MTSLFLSVICAFTLSVPQGVSSCDVTAKYSHEISPGQKYVFEASVPVEPGYHIVNAEGWPWYVVVEADSRVVAQCSYNHAIFIDGFESGGLEYW